MKHLCLILMLASLASNHYSTAQEDNSGVLRQKTDSSIVNTKEVKNRNVMLSAESSSTPRQLNIGLPFNGDILILENDLPVVYTFWTQIPTTVWRYDGSLGRMGVMSFAEGALTFGKVGYVVTSWDRDPGKKFRGFANFQMSNYGTSKYDVTLTGPIGKKGWGYIGSIHQTYDRGSGVNHQFTPFTDQATIVKAGISKDYKNGSIKFLYKHASTKTLLGAYSPFVYNGDGNISTMPGFKPGKDSYLLGDGLFPYYDYNSGESRWAKLGTDSVSRNLSNVFYLSGKHKFDDKTSLTYSAMYMRSNVSFTIQYPLSLSVQDADQRSKGELYKYYDNDKPYNGPVQMVAAQYYAPVDINTFLARAELTKKVNKHNLRGGFTFQYYNAPEVYYGGVYYQTVEKNPKLLDRYQDMSAYGMAAHKITKDGLLPSKGMGFRKEKKINKTALYVSDDLVVNNWLSGGVGARLELENNELTHYPYENQFLKDRELIKHKSNNNLNKVFTGNVVTKVTNHFGFLADATYNEFHGFYWDYADDQKDAEGYPIANAENSVHKDLPVKIFNTGGGIYWNHGELFSVVSKITHISKSNIVESQSVYNNAGEAKTVYPIIYDLKTLGWTTDIISSPFKNFNIHFLLTLQKPQYKNYSFKAFEQTYSYSNKTIPELSKVLIEIDPSYFLFDRNLRAWVSLRYFGDQFGNKTNAFKYNGWWESFAGLDYRVNRNLDVKLALINIFDQKGVKGALVGGDQITDASSFVGRKIVAGSIRPRTIEFSASYRF